MVKKFLFSVVFCSMTIFYSVGTSAQGFYAINTIQKIEIQFSQSNWDYILDTTKLGSDSYTMAKWVKINGVQFDSAGVKYKGNSSYNPHNVKNPLHIELDLFKSQNYQGYKDIKLSNGFKDPSFIREVLAYYILRNYMQASLSNYAQVYINNQYIGLYTNSEAVTKTFVDNYFFSNNNSFFFMDNFGGNLFYKGPDSTLYYMTYTMKSDYGWTDLVNLCNTLKNNISGIENVIDVDRTLWMLTFDNVLVNLDSYIGQPQHNYYIYEDHNGRFNPIIWDVNEAFGNFVNSGSGNLSISQEQTMSPTLHSNDQSWPLVKELLAVPMYKRMYIAHMRTIVSENFTNNSYYTAGQYLQGIVDTAVQSDPNKFYTYSQFISNLTTNVTSGPFTAPGITYLMNARTTYLNSTTEFQQVPPAISNIQPSDTFPPINSNIYITATVSNANSVFLGMRYSMMEKFTRIVMYDDGAHGDGASGDNTYGVLVPVTNSEIQYYIYAENNNAGIFSPQRAEHEYYTIHVTPDVAVNEFMASNQSSVLDPYDGKYHDWIELYNTTGNAVDLSGWYLSDNYNNPLKWQFPANTIISANDFLIIWADADTLQLLAGLHTNFKLSASGESVVLLNSAGALKNYVSYPQQYTDTSYGRYPNGTGNWCFMLHTYNNSNSSCISGINEYYADNSDIKIYPNPAGNKIFVEINNENPKYEITFTIYNSIGQIIYNQTMAHKKELIVDVSEFPEGIYIISVNNRANKKFIIAR